MLIGANRTGIAHNNIVSCYSGPYIIGNNPVIGIIAAAYHITWTGGGNCGGVFVTKKRITVTVSYQLAARLIVGIRIKPSKIFVFPVAPVPLFIFIHFIGGNIHKRFYRRSKTNRLKNIHRSHNICLVGKSRLNLRTPHQRLCR